MDTGASVAHTLAHLIQAGRRSAALSQQALADLAGLSLGAVRDLEQGRTRWPRRASLRRLAQVLSLTEPQLEVARGSNQPRSSGRSSESAGGIRLWVLGSLEIRRGHTLVSITSARQRAVLGLLAVSANEMVPRSAVRQTLQRVSETGTRVLGVVLNRAQTQRHPYYYGRYYGHYYGHYYGRPEPGASNVARIKDRAAR